jgi:DNA-binding MarR family transcriptional regulator
MTLKEEIIRNKNNDRITTEDIELMVKLERSRSILSRMMELELDYARCGVTPEQAAILDALMSKGGTATNAELANVIIRHYHSVVSIVNRMIKNGLIKKNVVRNQKKFLVSMTEKGEAIYQNLPRNAITVLFSTLSVKEKQELDSLLQKLIVQGRDSLGLDLPFISKSS